MSRNHSKTHVAFFWFNECHSACNDQLSRRELHHHELHLLCCFVIKLCQTLAYPPLASKLPSTRSLSKATSIWSQTQVQESTGGSSPETPSSSLSTFQSYQCSHILRNLAGIDPPSALHCSYPSHEVQQDLRGSNQEVSGKSIGDKRAHKDC